MECVYNFQTNAWQTPLPWKKPHMTWEMFRVARTGLLAASDKVLATTAMSDQLRLEYETYRQKLRDLPATYQGIDPWKIKFPIEPTIGGV
jgi:hypothetical protein